MNAPVRRRSPALQPHAAVSARQGQDPLSQDQRGRRARREGAGREVLVVSREAMRALAEAAFIDINHFCGRGTCSSCATSSTTRRRPPTTSSSPTIF